MENYARAKAQLFAQSKVAVVNADDEHTPQMLQFFKGDLMNYGINSNVELRAENIEYLQQGSSFEVNGDKYRLPVSGKFNIYNILAAMGAVLALQPLVMGDHQLRQAISEISGVPGRIQSVPNDLGMQVLVDYAHSPDGLTNIISSVREVTRGRVVTLFGCGGDRDKTKRPIMGRIAGKLSDFCIITSDNPRTEDPFAILAQTEVGVKEFTNDYIICENRRDAIFAGVKMLQSGDTLIIAGKGHEDYQEIGKMKYPFSDYGTAVEALQARSR